VQFLKEFESILPTNVFFRIHRSSLINIDFIKEYSLTNQSRILDFLSERILHMIYTNTDYFFSNLNIETIPVVNLHHSS
jgi:DNA-binding LytR/AlgR family response regulator